MCPETPSSRFPRRCGLAGGLTRTPPPLGTGTSQSPHSSDSGGSDVDLDSSDSKLFSRGESREPPGPLGCPSGQCPWRWSFPSSLLPCRVFLLGRSCPLESPLPHSFPS